MISFTSSHVTTNQQIKTGKINRKCLSLFSHYLAGSHPCLQSRPSWQPGCHGAGTVCPESCTTVLFWGVMGMSLMALKHLPREMTTISPTMVAIKRSIMISFNVLARNKIQPQRWFEAGGIPSERSQMNIFPYIHPPSPMSFLCVNVPQPQGTGHTGWDAHFCHTPDVELWIFSRKDETTIWSSIGGNKINPPVLVKLQTGLYDKQVENWKLPSRPNHSPQCSPSCHPRNDTLTRMRPEMLDMVEMSQDRTFVGSLWRQMNAPLGDQQRMRMNDIPLAL